MDDMELAHVLCMIECNFFDFIYFWFWNEDNSCFALYKLLAGWLETVTMFGKVQQK